MTWTVILTCLAIILARIGDVSIGTLRTIMVVQGRRVVAWILGFFEVLIWLLAAGKVLKSLDEPYYGVYYAIAYALGFATGNYVGLTVERWLSLGSQVVQVFTRRGPEVAAALRTAGAGVTEFEGRGRDGPVFGLYVHARRRLINRVLKVSREIDPECFYVVEDARLASTADQAIQATGWRAVLKKK